ncbi:MAG: mechanosensitive ion channel domain-containing protein [Desulfobaccales bacterium]
MASPFNLAFANQIISQARDYFFFHVLAWAMLAQIAAAACALLLAYKATKAIRTWITRKQAKCSPPQEICRDLSRLTTFSYVIGPALALFFLWIPYSVAEHFDLPRDGLYTIVICLLALALVRFLTGQMQNRFWATIIIIIFWFNAFLYIFHLNEPWLNLLQHIDFNLGKIHISLLTLFRAFVLVLVFYWLSRNLLFLLHFWLTAESGLTPAVQILLYKLSVIFLFCASVTLVLQYMGIGLTVFALFSGALGLGLGFGLQKVFANLVSGFIILADKSIKPGDVIQVGDKYGWINFLGTRYTSVITRNGTEHLIPNENLVTSEVINWSYSNNLVRIDLPVGVSYASDLEKVRDLILEVAASSARVLKDPKPNCFLKEFGDNSVNLDLRVWLNDPQNGIGSLKSELLWGIWQRFREHGIELPFPQRDLYLKSIPEVRIRTGPEEG